PSCGELCADSFLQAVYGGPCPDRERDWGSNRPLLHMETLGGANRPRCRGQ
ncbi:unnamed protein product, partial [Effrenium voratum]